MDRWLIYKAQQHCAYSKAPTNGPESNRDSTYIKIVCNKFMQLISKPYSAPIPNPLSGAPSSFTINRRQRRAVVVRLWPLLRLFVSEATCSLHSMMKTMSWWDSKMRSNNNLSLQVELLEHIVSSSIWQSWNSCLDHLKEVDCDLVQITFTWSQQNLTFCEICGTWALAETGLNWLDSGYCLMIRLCTFISTAAAATVGVLFDP